MDAAELFVRKIRLHMKRKAESDRNVSRSVLSDKKRRRAKATEEQLAEINRLVGALPDRFAGYFDNRRFKMEDINIAVDVDGLDE